MTGKKLHVDEMHGEICIYDKLGSGQISLTKEEAKFVQEKLEEILK